MIILPDRTIARGKFLMPMRKRDWHHFGCDFPHAAIHFQTWIAQAWRYDPHFHPHHKHRIIWQGHFEDREDADEFMWALYNGTIKNDSYLKRLPVYCPDFDPDMLRDPSIHYNMVSNIGIGPSSGNWGAPSDCYGINNRAGEFYDCIGAGGGAGSGGISRNSTGGGGGGFARRTDLAFTPGQQVAFDVGNGGAGGASANSAASGAGGTAHTYFYSPSNPGVQGNVGSGGTSAASSTVAGGAGGGANAGNYGYTGGAGGSFSGSGYGSCCSGGGAAANPSGNGAAGGSVGAGPAGQTTAGGASAGLIYGPWGPGSGGAGSRGAAGIVGIAGDHYGGGGGAAQNSVSSSFSQTGGAGGAGLIVIRYEPQYVPSITSITPNSGPTAGGQAITIGGSNFVEVTSANIGGAAITGLSVGSTTSMTGTTSAGGAGTYNVNVYRNNGPSPGVGGSLYTYVSPPTVSSCAPSSGPTTPHNAVLAVITGTNLNGVSVVTFDGISASPMAVINSTTVHAWVPAHAAGLVWVAVANSYGSGGAAAYTYVTPPSVSSCSPTFGLTLGNTAVTITGANMSGATSVTFGGAAATSVSVVNANTITCRTPAHGRGLVDIAVTNGYGTATGTNLYNYVLPASGFNMPGMGI